MSNALRGLLRAARPGADWITERDPRLRIVAAVLFALCVVTLQRPATLALAFALALLVAVAGGLGGRSLLLRLLPLELFMVLLLLTLPFSVAGEPLLRIGPLTASEPGLELALMILLRANAVLLIVLASVGTMEPARLGHALARLGVPEHLAHLLLLTVRQIHLVGDEYARLRQAMRARAFVPRSDRHTWNSIGWLMGMLLVRSLSRSRRVLDAMRCRGFDGRLRLLNSLHWQAADSAMLGAILLLVSALLVLDRFVIGVTL
ncbi:MAG: cobalt ECF transporter T component CbiQ [Thiohalocapsa sp.]